MEPPSTSPITSRTDNRLLISSLIAGAVAALVIGSIYFWGDSIIPKKYTLAVASDSLPLTAMQTVDLRDGTLAPVTIEEQGTAMLIDAVDAGDSSYYLISDPSFTRVNLYRKDAERQGLAELTHTGTVKYDLSVDADSSSAAYVIVGEGGAAQIIVWRNSKKDEEKNLGSGRHPVILPGGFFVIAEREGKIVSIEIESGEVHELLTFEANSPFAVDRENLKVVIYEPSTRTLQEYSIAGMTGGSYISSSPLAFVPRELAYVDGIPHALIANGKVLNFGPADALKEYPNVPFGFADGRKLTTYHD